MADPAVTTCTPLPTQHGPWGSYPTRARRARHHFKVENFLATMYDNSIASSPRYQPCSSMLPQGIQNRAANSARVKRIPSMRSMIDAVRSRRNGALRRFSASETFCGYPVLRVPTASVR